MSLSDALESTINSILRPLCSQYAIPQEILAGVRQEPLQLMNVDVDTHSRREGYLCFVNTRTRLYYRRIVEGVRVVEQIDVLLRGMPHGEIVATFKNGILSELTHNNFRYIGTLLTLAQFGKTSALQIIAEIPEVYRSGSTALVV